MPFSHPWIEIVAAATVGLATAITGVASWKVLPEYVPAEITVVEPGSLDFEPTGEFVRDGVEFEPRVQSVDFSRPIEIMKYQVTRRQYQECVRAERCEALDSRVAGLDGPATGVSYVDADAFAEWYSGRTGEKWRLPTAQEWAYVAAERFAGEVFSREGDPQNPAIAWIRRYEEQVLLNRKPDPVVHPSGDFGPNSNGVYDLAGNVWEWTSACYTRVDQDRDGKVIGELYENCGIRVVEGVHRSYMTNFIREGKSGGCAVGTPPDHLGFRLVRDGQVSALAAIRRGVARWISFDAAHRRSGYGEI